MMNFPRPTGLQEETRPVVITGAVPVADATGGNAESASRTNGGDSLRAYHSEGFDVFGFMFDDFWLIFGFG